MTHAYGNELYHHGVKGQKWGVRRYQNYDGTRIKGSNAENQLKIADENFKRLSNVRRKHYIEALDEDIKSYDEYKKTSGLSKKDLKDLDSMISKDKSRIKKLQNESIIEDEPWGFHSEDWSRLNSMYKHPEKLDKLSNYTHKSVDETMLDGTKLTSHYYTDKKGNDVAEYGVTDWNGKRELIGVRVSDKYKGRGLGSDLVREAVDKYGADTLYVYLDNKVAIKTYADAGFRFDKNGYTDEWKVTVASDPMGTMRYVK